MCMALVATCATKMARKIVTMAIWGMLVGESSCGKFAWRVPVVKALLEPPKDTETDMENGVNVVKTFEPNRMDGASPKISETMPKTRRGTASHKADTIDGRERSGLAGT